MSETWPPKESAPKRIFAMKGALYWTSGAWDTWGKSATRENVEYVRADIAAQDAADAVRFRWLVAQNTPDADLQLVRRNPDVSVFDGAWFVVEGLDAARAAIDAAMKEDGE